MPVDVRVNHIWTDAHAKLPNDEDAQTVSQNGQRDHGESQQRSLPGRAQKKIAGEQTGDEQNPGGMYAAAFPGYPECKARQLKYEILAEDRCGPASGCIRAA